MYFLSGAVPSDFLGLPYCDVLKPSGDNTVMKLLFVSNHSE
jgi:hypothetical protein